MALQSFSSVVRPSGTFRRAAAFVESGAKCCAALTVVRQGPRTPAAGGVALTAAALLHVLVVAGRTAGLARAVVHQVQEAAL